MLNDNELEKVSGGAIKWTIGIIIGSVCALIAGILDGYYRPLKCNR